MSESDRADESTGLPVGRTWRRVYLLVVLGFIAIVVFLVILERMFS